jgi:ABC-type antimicrobial peptide transport system permease subunit
MYEIGILRAMGLRQSEVRGMLIAESLTIMIAAGSMGMVIGTIIAYILQQNISVLTQLPPILAIDWITLIRTYLISITIGVLGIWAITWRTRKWRVIDTLRFSW